MSLCHVATGHGNGGCISRDKNLLNELDHTLDRGLRHVLYSIGKPRNDSLDVRVSIYINLLTFAVVEHLSEQCIVDRAIIPRVRARSRPLGHGT